MARIVVLGAGVAGHTAASFLQHWVGKDHEVVVITPNAKYNWIPSNIWVGVGAMSSDEVTFDLEPVYKKVGIRYIQARATGLNPEGSATEPKPFVTFEHTSESKRGVTETLSYDFLLNATGPKLNFGATPGLGPEKNSLSVCTHLHATEAAKALDEAVLRMKKGEKQKFLIGTGHGMATCQGAAFEYAFNVEYELRKRGVRDLAEITWISNEYELGDFGMGGMHIVRGGYITHSKIFTESLFNERDLRWITRAHVKEVGKGTAAYETLAGEEKEEPFDFAMLIPPFAGVGLKAWDKAGGDITSRVFAPSGFMLVDADYSGKPYAEWSHKDWPEVYQSPAYGNLFAAGIAFAPPHPISKPMKSPKGTPIFPTPPRTGMPSAIIGKTVAQSIAGLVKGDEKPRAHASMAKMGAACVASAGHGLFSGTAASMTVYPIVPNFDAYPRYGRDTDYTFGEIGLAGNWIKLLLHYGFLWKAQMKPGWRMVPE